MLTPNDPSSKISRARLTRPYAPRPISPSISNSDILRPPRKDSFSNEGEGGLVLAALSTLPELGVRLRLWGRIGGGEGGSTGAIETRPAISDTRCWEDRLRDRVDGEGDDGDEHRDVGLR